jgi:hypothetical protein
MNGAAQNDGSTRKGLKPTYLPRLMPVGMIVILLAILVPVLREKKPDVAPVPPVEPPLAMKHYSSGFPATDSLMNDALRSFGRKDYEAAARILAKVHFYWSVEISEGRAKSYPEDLRFYLGLAEFYRGRPDRAAPYLEAESSENPYEERYAWYLAHAYAAQGDTARTRETLRRIVGMNESLAPKAAELLRESRE